MGITVQHAIIRFPRYLSLLALLFVLLFVKLPAQVTTLSNWTNVYEGTGNSVSVSYTVPSGSNQHRLLVVGLSSSLSGNGRRNISSISYGDQAL
jgi:hypothetical protein